MYSDERMELLRREHGFTEYLDETFTAPDHIMQALLDRHNVDKVLVGGDGVQNSLERKDLSQYKKFVPLLFTAYIVSNTNDARIPLNYLS